MSALFTLTQNQLAIWLDQQAHPASALYNIGGCLAIHGEIRPDLMNQAMQHLIADNEALRLHIRLLDGKPRQALHSYFQYSLPYHDLSAALQAETEAFRWIEDQFQKPFSLENDIVYWQMALVRVDPDYYLLLTKYHHLIADGWSTKIVIDQLTEFYNSLYFKSAMPLIEQTSYAEFVSEEQNYLQSPTFERDRAFWNQQLNDLPEPLFKPKYRQQSALQVPSVIIQRFTLNRTFYAELNAWSDARQVTTYHLLLTGLCLCLSRINQQREFTVGIPSLNRRGARFKKLLGMCVSMSPLVAVLERKLTLQSLVKQISVAILKTHKHQRYPLMAMHKALNSLKKKRDPLFDVVFSYERQDYSLRLGDAEVQARQFFSGEARYPFAVTVCEFNDKQDVEIVFEGSENYFSAQELVLLEGRFKHVLQQFLLNPDCLASDVDLMPDREKQVVFEQFNTLPEVPEFKSVITQFQHWVEQNPDAVAVSLAQRGYSYLELDQCSEGLGLRLKQWHVMPGQIVAVCMPRSIETMVALLAIFKLRAVYLPMDADLPIARIQSMLEQSQAHVLLTLSEMAHQLYPLHDRLIAVDEVIDSLHHAQTVNESIRGDDLAYVIYTSGSTGKPKGSEISHAALSARLRWLQRVFEIRPHEKVGQSIQTHFDPSLIEIFLALCSGAQLVLAPWQRMTAESFAEFVITENINALALVPASLRALLQGLEGASQPHLRIACCGGEILQANLAKSFMQKTGARLLNVYGPTEATILASAWECQEDDESPLPIGRPLDYTQIYIVDENLKLLPLGVSGEIVIAGEGVAKGYFREPEQTENAFRPNPFHKTGNHLLYKTGDYGYISPDGLLYFSERSDRQVKISGYRIELAEVEQVLMTHASVQQAAVIAMSLPEPTRTVLVAYVVSGVDDAQALKRLLATFLRSQLPDYMQPKLIMTVDELPLTSLGKIDYRRLPEADFCLSPKLRRPARTPLEKELLTLWSETLSQSELGVDDDFFELDVDSLTAVSLLSRLDKRMGSRFSIAFLMAYPTIAMQAEYFAHLASPLELDILATLTQQSCGNQVYLAASGHGDQLRFQRLASELEGHCSLQVLYPSSELLGDDVTIAAIARSYVDVIVKQGHHAIYLAGFSIGGVTALETARLLEERGIAVKKVLLLDTIYPGWPLNSNWLFRALQWLAHCKPLEQISVNGRFLHSILSDPGIALQIQGLGCYAREVFKGRTVLIPTSGMQYLLPWSFWGWRKLLPNLTVMPALSGLHGAMFRETHLPELARIIRQAIMTDD